MGIFKEFQLKSLRCSQDEVVLRRHHSEDTDEEDLYEENPPEPFINIVKKKLIEAPKQYYINLSNPSVRKSDDVYKYLFLCDFVLFFVILFGFAAFGVTLNCACSFLKIFFKPFISF